MAHAAQIGIMGDARAVPREEPGREDLTMPPASEYFDSNGVRIHYLRAGRGDVAIVLTHGNSHCGGVWAPLVEALAGDRFTVIAPDLRGHGWSEKPQSGYHWAGLRDDLVGLVTSLDFRDVLYAGHSRGGGVSLLAAAATRDWAKGVLVYEPTVPVQAGADGKPAPVPTPSRMAGTIERAYRRREHFGSLQELAERYRGQDAFRHWREDYFQAFLDYGCIVREDGKAETCVSGWVAAKLLEATFGFDAWRDVYCPDLPVVLLYGDRSGRLGGGRDPVAGIRTMFPKAESRIFPDGTHTGPMEHPQEFERLVREFAARVIG
jgi:pimeloyl-ACP methyl ester carboxylesterase